MKSIRFLMLAFAFIFSAHAQGTPADASSKGAAIGKTHVTAGLDCTKASSDQEQLVCSTPSLLALDGQLQTAYQARRRLLTAEGASLLQASERSWLKFIEVACSPSSPYDRPGDSPLKCLEDKYKERLYQISQVGRRLGPFVFNRVDLFEARVISAPDSEAYLSVHHVAYPQIDAPASASTIEWNREMAKNMSDSCGGESKLTDADYQIGLANARMISVQESVEFYSNGPEQPAMESTVSNIVLSPAPRPLEPGDVFKPSADWKKRVEELFVAAFNATPESGGDRFPPDIVRIAADSPGNWLFTKQGIQISFDGYGCFDCGPGPLTVEWKLLMPMLSPTAVVP